MGFLPERPYFYEYLTGQEFLNFYACISQTQMSRIQIKERIHFLLKKVDLLYAKNKRLRQYSKGMLQKIGLAQALIHSPELAILDEPMAGLDPDGRFYISEIMREAAQEGTAVFFSSHLLHDVERLCEKLIVLKDGVVSFEGATQELINKMGFCSVIFYVEKKKNKTLTAKSREDLKKKLSQLIEQGCMIEEVRPERSLEEAFVKWGLRGEDYDTHLHRS